MKQFLFLFLFALSLSACSIGETALPIPDAAPETSTDVTPAATRGMGMGMGMGMGRQGGMMARHSAPIPEAYADLTNPFSADEASLQRGGDLFVTHCATCHGDGRIVEFEVFVRPFNGLQALGAAMAQRLA